MGGANLIAIVLLCLSAPRKEPAPLQANTIKPVILIYLEPGWTEHEEPPYLEFAAWQDGRIVWCDKPKRWANVGGKWQWTGGDHFEAKIDSKRVKDAVARVRASGAISLGEWNLFPPDASFYRMVVRAGNGTLSLSSGLRSPSDEPPYGREPQMYAKQLRAWKLVTQLALELRPKSGRSIKPLDVSTWRVL